LIEEDWTFLAVDQFTKRVQTVQRRGWYPIGSNPTIEVSSSRKNVTVLKAVTHEGDSFHCWTEENLTAQHGIRFLGALLDEFGEKLVILLDQASYFYAKDLWEFVSEERSTEYVDDTSVERVQREKLQVWYFPAHLPELNPVEGYWNKLNDWFKGLSKNWIGQSTCIRDQFSTQQLSLDISKIRVRVDLSGDRLGDCLAVRPPAGPPQLQQVMRCREQRPLCVRSFLPP
jgi:hypothetical protein